MRLNRDEFIDHAPDHGKIRVNHDSSECTGSSKSMVVERKDDGSISAKCFRCGAWGSAGKRTIKPSFTRTPYGPKRKASGIIPKDTSYEWSEFPPKVVMYLHSHGFDEATTKANMLGFSNKINRLVIPVKNLTRPNAGWVSRSFEEGETKYYTNTKEPKYLYHHLPTSMYSDEVLITEDVLSTIRGSEVLSTFALLGTELTESMKIELMQYNKFYLWLDNDNSVVKMKQLKIFNELSCLGEVNLIQQDKEPKDLTPKDIYNILYK